jgi:hypothetical protein
MGSLFGSRINPRMPLPGLADRRSRLDASVDDARAAGGPLLGRQTEVRHLASAVVFDEHVRAGVRYARFALSASPTIRVPIPTRDRLAARARQRGISLAALLEELSDQAERQAAFEAERMATLADGKCPTSKTRTGIGTPPQVMALSDPRRGEQFGVPCSVS